MAGLFNFLRRDKVDFNCLTREDTGNIPDVSKLDKSGSASESVDGISKYKSDSIKKVKSDVDSSENERLERSRIPIYVKTLVRLEIISKHRGTPRIDILSRLVDTEYDKIKKELYEKRSIKRERIGICRF